MSSTIWLTVSPCALERQGLNGGAEMCERQMHACCSKTLGRCRGNPDGYNKFPGGMLLRSHQPPHSFMQNVYRRTSHLTEMNEKFVFNVEKESDCPLSVINFIVVNFE